MPPSVRNTALQPLLYGLSSLRKVPTELFTSLFTTSLCLPSGTGLALGFPGKQDKPDPALTRVLVYRRLTPQSLGTHAITLCSPIPKTKSKEHLWVQLLRRESWVFLQKVTGRMSIYNVSWKTEPVLAQLYVHVFFLRAGADWLEQASWVLKLPTPVEFPQDFPTAADQKYRLEGQGAIPLQLCCSSPLWKRQVV